jgi:hypothetical protein
VGVVLQAWHRSALDVFGLVDWTKGTGACCILPGWEGGLALNGADFEIGDRQSPTQHCRSDSAFGFPKPDNRQFRRPATIRNELVAGVRNFGRQVHEAPAAIRPHYEQVLDRFSAIGKYALLCEFN